jgi:NAD(P)-dependent dehydrogenase (short-subunit alcohol dehydrogenase family)
VDILVNNAGGLRSTAVAAITPAEWDLVLDVNLKGTFLCAQAVFAAMVSRGGGRIVNMASMAGRATSTLGGAHYTAAKAGVLGLSRHLAREWAAVGITVNAVCPGIVDTPMVHGAVDAERLAQVRDSIPLGRLADPGEIASLVCFLASAEAAYITGASVDIHGGELIIQ